MGQATSGPSQQGFIVTVVPATPTKEHDLADVVIGALGVTGGLVLLALVLGMVVGVLRFGWIRRHPPDADHMPPVKPT